MIDPNDIAKDTHSITKHLISDGSISDKREELHNQISNDLYEGVEKPSGKQVFTMMGGEPASGKSTVMDNLEYGLPKRDQSA